MTLLISLLLLPFTGAGNLAHAASPEWTPVGLSSPGNVRAMINVGGTLYAGTQGGSNGIWTYSNGAWTQMSGSPDYVSSLLYADDGTLYAGRMNLSSPSNDVWQYVSGQWKPMATSPGYVSSLLEMNGTLYAGIWNGSNNAVWYYDGVWKPMSGALINVTSLLDFKGTLYAGAMDNGNAVWKYNDGEWKLMDNSPSAVTSLLNVGDTLYAVSPDGIWTYTNDTWAKMNGSPTNALSLLNVDGTLYAGQNSSSVWTYSDGTWKRMDGSPTNVLSWLDVGGTLYAGSLAGSNAVWTYSDGKWSGSPSYVQDLLEVGGILYAGTRNGSTDVWSYINGKWTMMGDSPGYVQDLLEVGGTLYAGTRNPYTGSSAVWTYSGNDGWHQMSGSPTKMRTLISVGGTLYAGTYNGNDDVWSYNNGTWAKMDGSPVNVRSLLDVSGTLYAGTYNGSNDVWAYNNGTWQQLSGSPGNVQTLFDVGGTLYAKSSDLWSYNSGTWTKLSGAPGNLSSLLSVGGKLYAGTLNFGNDNDVWSYGNGTWTRISGSPSYVSSIITANSELYTADSGGVHRLLIPPGTPAGLKSGNTTSAATTLTWGGVPGAEGYNIYTNDGDTTIGTVTGSTYTYTVSNLTPNTSYTFTVSAFNAAGESAQSDATRVSTAPSAPGSLAGSAGDGQVALTWGPVQGTVTYSVYEGTSPGSYGTMPIATVTGSTYSYTATGLTNGTAYYFAVTATNAGGSSSYSNEVSATPRPNLTVSYNGNGATSGSVPVDSRTYTPGAAVSVYGNAGNLAKTGYTFAGWNTQADGNGTNYAEGAVFSMGTSNVTLYAKWAANDTDGSSNEGGDGDGGGGNSSGSSNSTSTPVSNTVTSTDGTLTLSLGQEGEVRLGDEVRIKIPADAFGKDLQLSITKAADTQNLITNNVAPISPIFEILKNFTENFSKEITLTFAFDPAQLQGNQKPSVFYYDETKGKWVEVGGEVSGDRIIVKVNHFTKYAVFGVDPTSDSGSDTKQTVSFRDISGHWAEANIKRAVEAGIVSGYPDSTFKPDRSVTRAEFAVMLMNVPASQGNAASLTFTDKDKIGAWMQKSVAQAVYAGIINGYEDGSFRPDAEITRAEMAVMIARALDPSGGAAGSTGFADDSGIPDWAKGAVTAMKNLGVIEGKGANTFAPDDQTTRAEAVTVLLKMLALKK